jgi:hypothetical protein
MIGICEDINVSGSKSYIYSKSPECLRCYILAPSRSVATRFFSSVETNDLFYQRTMQELRDLRCKVYQLEGYAKHDGEQIYDRLDLYAWHIALKDELSGHWVGCNRMMVYDLEKQALSATDVLALGNIHPLDPQIKTELLQVIHNLIEKAARDCSPFCYFGGFAIDPVLQGRLYGMRLGVNSLVMLKFFDRPQVITFANMKSRAAKLFQQGGWEQLDPKLGPFYCKEHQGEGLLMHWHLERAKTGIMRRITEAEAGDENFKVITPV